MTNLPTDAIRWLITHDSDCAEQELKALAQLQALQDAVAEKDERIADIFTFNEKGERIMTPNHKEAQK